MRRRPRKFKKPKRRFYRINSAIQARELRVLDQKGKQVGLLSREEALSKAREQEVDLVEIAPRANPPVARIIDFSKFKYLENKKKQKEKKAQKKIETKEVRLSPVIAEHDFQVRLTQAREFLDEGNPLKISIRFKGRMITRKQFGYDVMNRFIEKLKDNIKVARPAKFEGKVLVAHVVREKKDKVQKETKTNNQ